MAGIPERGGYCDFCLLLYPDRGKNVGMLVTTTENPAGYRTQKVLGQVFGVVVRSRSLVGNIGAAFKSLAGGEIKQYTRLVEDARRHAIDRMIENAALLGANAVVMMRFDSSEIGQTMSEVAAYGTAVVLDPPPPA